jgi:hypothetical protein
VHLFDVGVIAHIGALYPLKLTVVFEGYLDFLHHLSAQTVIVELKFTDGFVPKYGPFDDGCSLIRDKIMFHVYLFQTLELQNGFLRIDDEAVDYPASLQINPLQTFVTGNYFQKGFETAVLHVVAREDQGVDSSVYLERSAKC